MNIQIFIPGDGYFESWNNILLQNVLQ